MVKDFKPKEKWYLSSDYQKSDVRNDLINKYFIALGWDVDHQEQKNQQQEC
jgi:hypothetical protein